jgi:hypothetical protein
MTTVLETVIALTAKQTGLPPEKLGARSAIYQDIGLCGDDVGIFVAALADVHGEQVRGWPWARFTNLSEPNLWTALGALVKVPYRMLRRRRDQRSRYERLELGHIAAVIESGHWHEP